MPNVATLNVGVSGSWTTPAGDKIPEVQRRVVQYERASSPFMTWLSMTEGKMLPSGQLDWTWYEDQYDRPTDTITGGLTGGATTEASKVIQNNPAVIVGAMYHEPEQQQHFIVDASTPNTPSGSSTVTLRRLDGGNIAAISGAVTLVSISTGMIENGYMVDPTGGRPMSITNTFSKSAASISVTAEESRSANYWGMKWEKDRDRAVSKLRKDIERNLLLSKYSVTTDYTQTTAWLGGRTGTLRTTRGLLATITRNQPYSGALDRQTLHAFLNSMGWPSEYSGSDTKMALFGNQALSDLQNDLSDQIRILDMGKLMYGIEMRGYIFGANKIFIMKEPTFYNFAPYRKGIVLVDPAFLYLRRYFENLIDIQDTSLQTIHAHSMSMIAMYGLQYEFEYTGAKLTQP